jgi:hypothetical protein
MRDQRGTPVRVSSYTPISTDEDHQKCSLDAQGDRLEADCKAQWRALLESGDVRNQAEIARRKGSPEPGLPRSFP